MQYLGQGYPFQPQPMMQWPMQRQQYPMQQQQQARYGMQPQGGYGRPMGERRQGGICYECGGPWPCRKDPTVCEKGRPQQPRPQPRPNPQREKRLEHVKAWSQQVLCCFYLQGTCKYDQNCMYSHEDKGNNPCHFGLACKHNHEARKNNPPKEAEPAHEEAKEEAPAADAAPEAAEPEAAEKPEAEAEEKKEEEQ